MSSVIVGYSANDFFYAEADANGMMPADSSCNMLLRNKLFTDASCNTQNFADNAQQCIARELCTNKAQVQKILAIQARTNGADEKYMDSSVIFDKTLLTTFNLGVGILILSVLIYRNRIQ